jgi:hypothetical protein
VGGDEPGRHMRPKHEVHHCWSCDNCGHEIEIVVDLRISATSGAEQERRVNAHARRIVKTFAADPSTISRLVTASATI